MRPAPRVAGSNASSGMRSGESQREPTDQTKGRLVRIGAHVSGLLVSVNTGVSKNSGPLFGSPYNKSPTILGSILGPPIVGNSHIPTYLLGMIRVCIVAAGNRNHGSCELTLRAASEMLGLQIARFPEQRSRRAVRQRGVCTGRHQGWRHIDFSLLKLPTGSRRYANELPPGAFQFFLAFVSNS